VKPLQLHAENFRTFPTLDITFRDGLVGILGELRDTNGGADSNGAGKSSVLEAIDICLFGRRSLAGFLTRGGDVDELTLELTFAHGHEVYRVRRQFSARGRGKTSVDFERRTSDGDWLPLTRETAKQTDALIVETIGLSRATFRDSGYLRQGGGSYADPSRDPKERLELLVEAALGRDPVWPRAQESAKAARREAQAQLERLAGETQAARDLLATRDEVQAAHERATVDEEAKRLLLVAVEVELQEIVARYQAARDAAALRQVAEAEAQVASEAFARVSEQFSQATAAAHQLADKTVELAELAAAAARVAELEQQAAALRALAAEATALTGRRDQLLADSAQRTLALDRMLAQVGQLTDDARVMRGKADHLEAHIGESADCDRCGQKLGAEAAARAADSYRTDALKLDQQAAEIDTNASADREAIAGLREQAAAINIPAVADPEPVEQQLRGARRAAEQAAALTEQVRQLTEKASYQQQLEQDLAAAAEAVTEKQEASDAIEPVDLAAIEAAGADARANVARLRDQLDEAKVQRGRLDEKLAALATAEQALTAAATTERDLHATIDTEAALEKACGRSGIPTLILESVVIPTLEAKATHILAELGTGYRVELRTQAALKDGGLRDTCEAVVIDATGEAPYDDFSGGEQTRIGLALQIALAEFIATRPGADSSFLALDEPTFLDRSGMEALLAVLRDLIARQVFDTVMLVSHVPELRDSLDETILIVKDGATSRVDVGTPAAVAA